MQTEDSPFEVLINDRDKMHVFDHGSGIQFRIVVPIVSSPELEAVEFWHGALINGEKDICIFFKEANSSVDMFVNVGDGKMIGRIGTVPLGMLPSNVKKKFINNDLEFDGYVLSMKKMVGVVNPGVFMSISEEIEMLSEERYDRLLKEMESALSSIVFDVIVGVRLKFNGGYEDERTGRTIDVGGCV